MPVTPNSYLVASERWPCAVTAGVIGLLRALGHRARGDPVEPECLHELVNDFVGAAGDDCCRDAGLEVVPQDQAAGPFEGALHGRELFHHFGAVGVFFDHPDDAVEMTPGRLQSVQHVTTVCIFHACSLPLLGWDMLEAFPQGGGKSVMTAVYDGRGMTCDHCVAAVRAELCRVDGVQQVDVDLTSGEVTVSSHAPLDLTAVRRAVDEAGYELVASN
jgi:copper chaperone CopZ